MFRQFLLFRNLKWGYTYITYIIILKFMSCLKKCLYFLSRYAFSIKLNLIISIMKTFFNFVKAELLLILSARMKWCVRIIIIKFVFIFCFFLFIKVAKSLTREYYFYFFKCSWYGVTTWLLAFIFDIN